MSQIYSGDTKMVQCWGPAPAGSKGTLQRDGVGDRERENVAVKKVEEEQLRGHWQSDARVVAGHTPQLLVHRIYFLLALGWGTQDGVIQEGESLLWVRPSRPSNAMAEERALRTGPRLSFKPRCWILLD